MKKGSTLSPATVNRELRHLRAFLRVAHGYGYLRQVPEIKMVCEPDKLPRYVTPEHFAVMYRACHVAVRPIGLSYPAEDWWHALLVFNYMTAWQIGEPLSLRREDLDLDGATAMTRYADNKGNRDDLVPLHAVVIDHLRKIQSFEPVVFPWYHARRTLWSEFLRIQQAAGINLIRRGDHEHTPSCHVYGFHDLRRAFATVNATRMTGDALQKLMRHRHYSTTQRYINMAGQLRPAVEGLHVPEVLRRSSNAAN